jgi:hypothetical protein
MKKEEKVKIFKWGVDKIIFHGNFEFHVNLYINSDIESCTHTIFPQILGSLPDALECGVGV